ncbi:hypothetical protein HanIR_Chr05g0245231 [Helianthus annuus]|nr:hypothetical protein HanIR_Chr05g0245231 [Helianthus annuus]
MRWWWWQYKLMKISHLITCILHVFGMHFVDEIPCFAINIFIIIFNHARIRPICVTWMHEIRNSWLV